MEDESIENHPANSNSNSNSRNISKLNIYASSSGNNNNNSNSNNNSNDTSSTMVHLDAAVFQDSRLTPVEIPILKEFYSVCIERRTELTGEADEFFDLAGVAGVDLKAYYKESTFTQSLWFIYLSVLKSIYNPAKLKYPTIQSFMEAYEGVFDGLSEQELFNLWSCANWMAVLFTMVQARKNKGLAILIIPKLIEGWSAKYVTGSGQTRATASRVHIFETEGDVKPHSRGRVNPSKAAHAFGVIPFRVRPGRKAGKKKNIVTKIRSESVDSDAPISAPKKRGRKPKDFYLNQQLSAQAAMEGSEGSPNGLYSRNNFSPNYRVAVAVSSEVLAKQEAARRWVSDLTKSKSDSNMDDDSPREPLAAELPPTPSGLDPLMFLRDANNSFDKGILSRDVSQMLKSGEQQELLTSDQLKLERFTSWGQYHTLSPRTCDQSNVMDTLFTL